MPKKPCVVPVESRLEAWTKKTETWRAVLRQSQIKRAGAKRALAIISGTLADAIVEENRLFHLIVTGEDDSNENVRMYQRAVSKRSYWEKRRDEFQVAVNDEGLIDLARRRLADWGFPGDRPYQPTEEEEAAINNAVAGGTHEGSRT